MFWLSLGGYRQGLVLSEDVNILYIVLYFFYCNICHFYTKKENDSIEDVTERPCLLSKDFFFF